MASETRTAAESIRESAREVMQAYRAGRSLDGDDVGNVAHDLEDAAAEIARLTRELEEARERERVLVDAARLSMEDLEEVVEVLRVVDNGAYDDEPSMDPSEAIMRLEGARNRLWEAATPPAEGGSR